MTRDQILAAICESIKAHTHIGQDGDSTIYELPFRYEDGDQIELAVTSGQISDNGKTLLRLLSEDRLKTFEEWEEAAGFLRMHRMQRMGSEFIFTAKSQTDLVRFVQGLRDLESKIPSWRERSEDFDDVVRIAVRNQLEKAVDADRLGKDQAEAILNPHYIYKARVASNLPALSLEINADFMNIDETELVVVLSHGGDSASIREKHIRYKLADHALLRNQRRIRSLAVIPKESEYSTPEENLITLFTGQHPIRLPKSTAGKVLVRRLLTTATGYFQTD